VCKHFASILQAFCKPVLQAGQSPISIRILVKSHFSPNPIIPGQYKISSFSSQFVALFAPVESTKRTSSMPVPAPVRQSDLYLSLFPRRGRQFAVCRCLPLSV